MAPGNVRQLDTFSLATRLDEHNKLHIVSGCDTHPIIVFIPSPFVLCSYIHRPRLTVSHTRSRRILSVPSSAPSARHTPRGPYSSTPKQAWSNPLKALRSKADSSHSRFMMLEMGVIMVSSKVIIAPKLRAKTTHLGPLQG